MSLITETAIVVIEIIIVLAIIFVVGRRTNRRNVIFIVIGILVLNILVGIIYSYVSHIPR